MFSKTPLNKARFMQWADVMRQLRPAVTPEDIANLVPWRYKFVTSFRDSKVAGVGTYYPTASLIRGKFNYLADLVVDAKYRGQGVGAEMMREIIHPKLSCELDSGLERVDAHRFYLDSGFAHTGYAVRPPINVLATIGELPQQATVLIDGVADLKAKSAQKQQQIQDFIDTQGASRNTYQANLQLFMQSNPDHRLLILQGEQEQVEGVLLFELQNRLSFGGNCLHVTDLIVAQGAKERQEALLFSLLQQAKNFNSSENTSSIKTVIVEMTEEEVKRHQLLNGNATSELPKDKTTKININSFFSVSSKHFVKLASADKELEPAASWHRQRNLHS